MKYITVLDQPLEERSSGAKAFHLSKMKRKGFPIPDGFVISSHCFKDFYLSPNELPSAVRLEVEQELQRIGASHYMVRSSAIGEDSEENSFAGQLDSFLCTSDLEDIVSHIYKCWTSYEKDNVLVYQKNTGKVLQGMAVVVQELIDPDHAGVIFTRSHLKEGHMLVEYVQGHGEQLVSGAVNPFSFHYSIAEKTTEPIAEIDLAQGLLVAAQIEQFYGAPTDIEWALKGGKFYVVQARPITTPLKSKEVYWSNTNVNENYPEAISPLLYSVARDSYYHYFKNLSKLFQVGDDDLRRLEPAYCNIIGVFACKMYYNMSSIHQILSASPFADILIKSFDNFVGYAEGSKKEKRSSSLKEKVHFIREFVMLNRSLAANVLSFERITNAFNQRAKQAVVYEDFKSCFHEFIEIRMHSWYRASVADFFAMAYHGLLGKFCGKYYEEDADGVHNKLIQAIPNLISSQPIVHMHRIIQQIRRDKTVYEPFRALSALEFWNWLQSSTHKEVLAEIETYLENWGFRCSGELMLTSKNYIEAPDSFVALLQQYERLPEQDPEQLIQEKAAERVRIQKEFVRKIYKKHWWFLPKALFHIGLLKFLIRQASAGISSRERVRLKQALVYFRFKQTLQKIESVFIKNALIENAGDILYMRYQEIAENLSASDMLHQNLKVQIAQRKAQFDLESRLIYPDDFYTKSGDYTLPSQILSKTDVVQGLEGRMKGMTACGGKVKGRAKVLASVLEAGKLEKGDIMITRQTDPGWVVVFPLISGLIVERGGMLSHGAIVSREFGIPAIVGVVSATSLIKDGDLLLLDADRGEISICNETIEDLS